MGNEKINKLLVGFIILVVCFALDRFSKIYILNILNNEGQVDHYINQYLNIYLVWNTGIGFGLFSSNSDIIYNLTSLLIILVIICLIYFLIGSEKYEKIIYSIIVGGALGNFYDRMFFKAVPDFIDLHYKNFHWFTFNLADIFITLGIIAFLFKEIFKANQ